ncbi:interleukin-36 alpha-like [Elgaria multicarinata webbii]|uniref:interleukin-36 alpha-like n=1 Tax=Elgaria multicarinata webbii TaxID=159646 RepID=UPI002FCD67C4
MNPTVIDFTKKGGAKMEKTGSVEFLGQVKGTVDNHKLEKPWLFSIWDINQKFFSWENNTLIAGPKNSNSAEELIAVVPNRAIPEKENTYPIILGHKDGKHVLSCVEAGGHPQLQIVEKRIMDLYNKNEELKSFTFFSKTGPSNDPCNVESVAFPGWFISTSTEPNKPIALSHPGQTEITDFYFDKKEPK